MRGDGAVAGAEEYQVRKAAEENTGKSHKKTPIDEAYLEAISGPQKEALMRRLGEARRRLEARVAETKGSAGQVTASGESHEKAEKPAPPVDPALFSGKSFVACCFFEFLPS